MMPLHKGRYVARFAESDADLFAAQRLRWLCFLSRRDEGQDSAAIDSDEYDAICRHVLVENTATGQLICCFRFLHLTDGSQIERSYSARHYSLSRLRSYPDPMVEMGRFCIHPAHRDPDILRMAWAAMTGYIDAHGVKMLFGCSSFLGAEPVAHAEALAMLGERHIAPRRWLPRVKAPTVVRFARALARRTPDPRAAMAGMPPLLRSYLIMGGWVSDHAVVDSQMDTLHVFTGLEIGAIPPARQRLLRGLPG